MSVAAMKNSRLGLGAAKGKRRGNKLRRPKPVKSGRKLTNVGQAIVRVVMSLLALSLLASLGVGLLYGYRFITTSSYFQLETINVEGLERLSRGDILKTGGVNLGLNCLEMNVGEVKNLLIRDPWIEAVTVRRELPDALHIQVTEKVPAFWAQRREGLFFADARGEFIAPMQPGETGSMPVLQVDPSVEDGAPVLTGLLAKIEARQTPFTQDQAAWIRLTSAREMEIYLDGHDRGAGLTVKLSMDRWELQLERVKIAWRDLMRRGEFKDAAIIAASGDKVWVKKRPAEG